MIADGRPPVPWDVPFNPDQFGFKSPHTGQLTFLSIYIGEYFAKHGITTSNFPLIVTCPECKAAVTGRCLQLSNGIRGMNEVNYYHFARIDAAKARIEKFPLLIPALLPAFKG